MQSLSLAVNFVPYDVNRIFDKQAKCKPDDILGGYAPHLPIEILGNQNIINISSKNPSELKKILELLEDDTGNTATALSNLELLMRSDKSTRR